MRVVVGLGNPGRRYARTRHNFGYWVVESLAEKLAGSFKAGKGDYLYCRDTSTDLLMIKPTSYMNDSGLPVKEALAYYDAEPADLTVVYDDIDLPLGSVRLRPEGSSGGHKGMDSIIYHLDTDSFQRFRLGIATDAPMRPSERYVLQPFRKQDQPLVDETIVTSIEALNYLHDHTIEETMTRYNTRIGAQEESKGEQSLS